MNKKEILKEESNKMRKLMGLKPINEDMLDDIINKIKDSDVVKKLKIFLMMMIVMTLKIPMIKALVIKSKISLSLLKKTHQKLMI